jgi:hypothetical protein
MCPETECVYIAQTIENELDSVRNRSDGKGTR